MATEASPSTLPASAEEFCANASSRLWPGSRVLRLEAMQGDASTRSYARLLLAGGDAPPSAVLMMLRDAAVALSSEELSVFGESGPRELPFVNVARFLRGLTDAVPAILAVAADSTLVLLEDVGDTPLWEAAGEDGKVEATFAMAVDFLADLQARARDDGSGCYAFTQAFDQRLFRWEFAHFLEYGVAAAPERLLAAAGSELDAAALRLAALPRAFSHRDYHAWNIHVQDGRLRLIDFQDALLAPPLYDLASLLTDRITPERIVPEIEERLLRRFYEAQSAGRLGSLDETREAYRLLALQRVLKVVGRFHYLAEVKGKPHYLSMLPAVCRTARRLLANTGGDTGAMTATAELFEVAGRDPDRGAA
jgi:aminoglycoside/choline kinase family phosphotransferase